MADLAQFKEKYASVLELVEKLHVRLDHLHVQDGKLVMQGAAHDGDVKNKIWNAIKEVDPIYGDIQCDLSIDPSLPPPPDDSIYTVVAGDSLWKIAQEHLGNGALYPQIIAANPGKLKDEKSVIHPGDKLHIPAKHS